MQLTPLLVLFMGSLLRGQGAVQQAPSLTFQGAVTLTLGMSESAVRQALNDYTLSAPQPDSMGPTMQGVLTKSGPPFRYLGSVTFDSGKLVMARVLSSKR